MAVRTHYTMPGTEMSGLPVQVQAQPYATLAYAATPNGGVTPLVGYPSVYPHVLNVNPRRNYDAATYAVPAPQLGYVNALMDTVMRGLGRGNTGGRGGVFYPVAPRSQQPVVSTPPPSLAPSHRPGGTVPTLAPAHNADTAPAPYIPPIAPTPFNGALYNPIPGRMHFPQSAVPLAQSHGSQPTMATNHAPTASVPSMSAGHTPVNRIPTTVPASTPLATSPFNGTMYAPSGSAPMMGANHDPAGGSLAPIVASVNPVEVELPTDIDGMGEMVAPMENPVQLPTLLSQLVNDFPNTALWDIVRAYLGANYGQQ